MKKSILPKRSEKEPTLKEIETKVLGLLDETYRAVVELSNARLRAKFSNTRITGVARELKELIKVMAVYKSA